jgi:hypothetical protein
VFLAEEEKKGGKDFCEEVDFAYFDKFWIFGLTLSAGPI